MSEDTTRNLHLSFRAKKWLYISFIDKDIHKLPTQADIDMKYGDFSNIYLQSTFYHLQLVIKLQTC